MTLALEHPPRRSGFVLRGLSRLPVVLGAA
jgi:hypothetical protein